MRERILDTAFRHFIRFGYSKTTLSGIAEEIGKQKSAIYYYYKNKEDIFNSIVGLEAARLFEDLEKIILSKEEELVVFQRYVASRVHSMYNVASRYKLLKEEIFFLLPQIEMARSVYHEREISLLEDFLNKGVSNHVFKKSDTHLMAKVIVNTLKGLEIPMFVKNEFKADAREIDILASIFMNGITIK